MFEYRHHETRLDTNTSVCLQYLLHKHRAYIAHYGSQHRCPASCDPLHETRESPTSSISSRWKVYIMSITTTKVILHLCVYYIRGFDSWHFEPSPHLPSDLTFTNAFGSTSHTVSIRMGRVSTNIPNHTLLVSVSEFC